MTVIEPTVEQVREYATRQGIKPATLARMAGLQKNVLRGIFRPDWNPRASTLHKVADAINRHAEAA